MSFVACFNVVKRAKKQPNIDKTVRVTAFVWPLSIAVAYLGPTLLELPQLLDDSLEFNFLLHPYFQSNSDQNPS